MPLQRPWLPDPGRPGYFQPLGDDVLFPATRRELTALGVNGARALAQALGIPNAASLSGRKAINQIAQKIGFKDIVA